MNNQKKNNVSGDAAADPNWSGVKRKKKKIPTWVTEATGAVAGRGTRTVPGEAWDAGAVRCCVP